MNTSRGRQRTLGRSRYRRGHIGVLLGLVLIGGCGTGRTGNSDSTASTSPASTLPAGSTTQSITVDGMQRSYRTYVPENLDRAEPVPLVVVLHGGYGTGEKAETRYGWNAEATAEGFVVAYPDGHKWAWNAGTCCGKPAKENIDDVSFITDMVDDIDRQIAIDPRRTYATGISNGAMMALRLACDTDGFAAVAPVAGAQMTSCNAARATSILQIHGTADTNVPMDGSPGDGRGQVPAHTPVAESIATWRKIDDCETPSTTIDGPVRTSTSTCAQGREVRLVTIDGAGHQWPGQQHEERKVRKMIGADEPSTALDATTTIWAFLATHPAPA